MAKNLIKHKFLIGLVWGFLASLISFYIEHTFESSTIFFHNASIILGYHGLAAGSLTAVGLLSMFHGFQSCCRCFLKPVKIFITWLWTFTLLVVFCTFLGADVTQLSLGYLSTCLFFIVKMTSHFDFFETWSKNESTGKLSMT